MAKLGISRVSKVGESTKHFPIQEVVQPKYKANTKR
jgi:hypothetical protein